MGFRNEVHPPMRQVRSTSRINNCRSRRWAGRGWAGPGPGGAVLYESHGGLWVYITGNWSRYGGREGRRGVLVPQVLVLMKLRT